jgi:hypothetical protein
MEKDSPDKSEELRVLDIYCENQSSYMSSIYDGKNKIHPEIQAQIALCEQAGASRKEIEEVLKPYTKLS